MKPIPAGRNLAFLLWLLPFSFLAVFYFFPLIKILGLSFSRGDGNSPWLELAASESLRGVLWFTIWQAVISTALTLLVGLPGAYVLARYDFRGKSLFRALTGVPFVMPTLVVAAGFNALLGPTGWANTLLIDWFNLAAPPIEFVNTLGAILVAHVFYNLTIVLRLVGDFWARLDPRLGNAARVLGANRWHAFRRINLPLLMPAIAAAALLVFIFDFSSFAVILLLGGPKFATLETEIFYRATALFDLPVAAALATVQLLCTLALAVVYTRLSARIARPMTQRSQGAVQRPLPKILIRKPGNQETKKCLFLPACFPYGILAFILLFTALPLFALAARSFVNLSPEQTRTGEMARGVTLAFYAALLGDAPTPGTAAPPWVALAVSLGYAAATVGLALLLGLPAAWSLAPARSSRLNRLLDPIIMLPLGTSAVTLGLGFIVALNRPPLDLRASPLLIPLAHTLVAFPFVVRSLTPALQSIQPGLRRAAAMLGAAPAQVVRYVDLPLVGRALLVAATFAFTISLGEFGATSLIARPEYPTVPVAIYRLLGRPGALNYGQGLALSTILMVVTAGGMILIERWRVGEGEF